MSTSPAVSEAIEVEEKIIPMWKLVALQFAEHRMALAGVFILLLLGGFALLAPWISSWTRLNPDDQNPLARYQKPWSISAVEPFSRSQQLEVWSEGSPEDSQEVMTQLKIGSLDDFYSWIQRDFSELKTEITGLSLPPGFLKLFASFERRHWLGTDELGRDVFIRLIYGARVSMGVGVLVALAAALIGLLIGGLAGFYGGFLDNLLMRLTDSLLSLPTVPVLIVMAAIDLKKIPILGSNFQEENQSLIKMVLILCAFSWMQVSRLVRANVLSIREREFVLAARTLGGRDRQILLWHIVPNVIAPMLVAVTLGIGNAILYESILSFLGLGIQPPTPSWGNMLFNAQELVSEAPTLAITPGLLILLAIVSFNYVGDGLQDAVDPKAIRR
jgi:peptide/nickel transport system permease protein